MDIRIIGENHNPQEYEGLIFNMSKEYIPIRLAQEVARVGSMELWQYQAFVHHEHPFMGGDSIEKETHLVDEWTQMLSHRFPDYRFVIEVCPTDRMTWYQVTSTSPKEDDAEFEDYSPPIRVDIGSLRTLMETFKDNPELIREKHKAEFVKKTPRVGSVGNCEQCDSSKGFSEPFGLDGHRGVRMITCNACGASLIHSTKTIRFVVGPD